MDKKIKVIDYKDPFLEVSQKTKEKKGSAKKEGRAERWDVSGDRVLYSIEFFYKVSARRTNSLDPLRYQKIPRNKAAGSSCRGRSRRRRTGGT